MVLNSLRAHRKRFNKTYGELVIATDNRHYWRKDIFPYYKAHRKKDRDKSKFDWNVIFGMFDKIKSELRDNFPYKMLDIDGAEADDIVGVLCKYKHPLEKIMIVSGDKDFIQLHKYKGVKQYSPITKQYVRHADPIAYKKEHIIRGDRGDGIPNFLSADDCLVEGVRQTGIAKKKLDVWLTQKPEVICETTEMGERWSRNKQLVDLDLIPQGIVDNILGDYDTAKVGSRMKLFNYFISARLKNLIDVIDDF